MKTTSEYVRTAFGDLEIVTNQDGAVVRLEMPRDRDRPAPGAPVSPAAIQLTEYFDGRRTVFDLELAPDGTEFQKEAWRALLTIPYGETRSYGEQAAALGRPNAARAIGRANATNPIPIIVPCHRVIGADGSLAGFAGGLDWKRSLLALEASRAQPNLLFRTG